METWAKGFHDFDHTQSLVSFANIYANVQTYRPEHVYSYNTMEVDFIVFLCVHIPAVLLYLYLVRFPPWGYSMMMIWWSATAAAPPLVILHVMLPPLQSSFSVTVQKCPSKEFCLDTTNVHHSLLSKMMG